jgi:hypothetical protein
MATELREFRGPDGFVYEVEVTDGDYKAAAEEVRNFIKQEAVDEYSKMPLGQKMWQTVKDEGRVIADTASMGLSDRLSGYFAGDEYGGWDRTKLATELARERLTGPAETASTLAGIAPMALSLPSFAVKGAEYIGGGPLIKALTGTTIAGTENAALGGVEAAARGEDIPEGMLDAFKYGAGAHLGVQGVTKALKAGKTGLQKLGLLAKPAGEAAEAAAPLVRKRGRPSKEFLAAEALQKQQAKQGETLRKTVDRAKLKANSANSAGYDKAISTQLSAILNNPEQVKMFTPETIAAMKRVVEGTPVSSISRAAGKIPMIGGAGSGAALGGLTFPLLGPAGAAAAGVIGGTVVPSLGILGRRTANSEAKRLTKEMMQVAKKESVDPGSSATPTVAYNLLRMLGM